MIMDGVYLVKDQEFSCRFNLRKPVVPNQPRCSRRPRGNKVFQYAGAFNINTNLIPTNFETPGARNFYRAIQSILEDKGLCSKLFATLRVNKTMQTDGVPPIYEVICKLNGSMLRRIYNNYTGDLAIKMEITLCKVGAKGSGARKSDMTLHFFGMQHLEFGTYLEGIAGSVIWTTESCTNFTANANKFVDGTINIELIPYCTARVNPILPQLDRIGFPNMSMNDPTTDFELVGRDGSGARCHLSILQRRIPIFETISENENWPESKNKIYKFHKVSDKGVVEFVRYLYTSNVDVAKRYPEIAFELLELGHQYGISYLEQCMISIFLDKPRIWYDLPTAWNVFAYSTRLWDGYDGWMPSNGYGITKDKAIRVIKNYVKIIFVDLPKSLRVKEDLLDFEDFKELLKMYPDAVNELQISLPARLT